MNLVFGPDDHDGFIAASHELVGRFEAWLRTTRLPPGGEVDVAEMAANASLALDWKWSYGDGDLCRWRTTDVAEFLLEWCPRKLSVPQAECRPIPAALARFTAFLDAEGCLAPGSSSVAALSQTAERLTDEFVAEMGDASNFGLAKSLMGAVTADGVDVTDRERLEEWMEEFNARPEDERRRLIPDTAVGLPRRPALPPVAVPTEGEVAASKAGAPILGAFARLADFVGQGRKLTQTGNLTLADARVLIDLLGTGDAMDQRIGDRTFKTRSSADLPGLRLVFAWAKKAGVLRVAHGRVIATKRGLAIAADPAAFFDRAVDALLAIGALSSQRDPTWWFAWPDVNKLLDQFTVHLLIGPYVAQGPVPIDDLAAVAGEAVLNAFEFRSLDDAGVVRRVGTDVIDIVDALELAGMVVRKGAVAEADRYIANPRRRGGTVELTPAGVATTRRLAVEAGYEAPVAGRFADATAAELLLATDTHDVPALWGEIQAWLRRRGPVEAAAGLAAAVRELDDPALRNLALAVMGNVDVAVAEPEVRKLATEPGSRGFALCWLVDHDLEPQHALFDPDDVASFVDVLVHRFVTSGPDALCDTLALAGGHDAQIRLIGRLWRSPSTATGTVLAAIGEIHPVKAVAKAARKAAFQRRSWLGA